MQEKLWTPSFIGMGATSALFYLTQYILITTLPIIVLDSFHGTEFQAGLAMVFFQIGTVLIRPIAGEIIDSFDKNRVMFVSIVVFLAIMLAFNFVQSLDAIYLLRTFHGMSFAIGTTAAAAMATLILPKSRKGEGVGYLAVFSNLAMVLGPSLGLVVVMNMGGSGLFACVSLIALLAFAIICFTKVSAQASQPRIRESKKRTLADFYEKKALPWGIMGLFVSLCYSSVLVFVPIMMKLMGAAESASLFFILYALSIVVTRPIIGRVFDNKGINYALYPGFALFIIGLCIITFADNVTMILLSAPIIGIGFGALSPAFQTLAVTSVAPSRAGTATANYFLSMDIGVGVGSILLAKIAGVIGYNGMYAFTMGVAILSFFVYVLYVRRFAVNYNTEK